jgi:hypothetical protein
LACNCIGFVVDYCLVLWWDCNNFLSFDSCFPIDLDFLIYTINPITISSKKYIITISIPKTSWLIKRIFALFGEREILCHHFSRFDDNIN